MEDLKFVKASDMPLDWVTPQVQAALERTYRRAYFHGSAAAVNYLSLNIPLEKVNGWVYGEIQDWMCGDTTKIVSPPVIKK